MNSGELAGSTIAFMTGTFDPFHYGHLEALLQALENGADYAFVLVHSFTNGKTPAPVDFRRKLVAEFTRRYKNIADGTNLVQQKSALSEDELFTALKEISPSSKFVRVVGSEKPLGDNAYFVHRRVYGKDTLVSNEVMKKSSPYSAISSSKIRDGELPMPVEYEHLETEIRLHYPKSCYE